MKITLVKAGLIVALTVEIATLLVGYACLFGGIKTLGPVDWLMYPGGVLGWLFIWGDNFSNTVPERLGMIAISLVTNAVAGFLGGVGLAAIWKLRSKIWPSNDEQH